MDRIKVLFVSHENHMRMGAQNSMAHLIGHLDRDRFEPYCLMPSEGELSERLEHAGCKCFYIPLPTIKPKHFRLIPNTLRFIRNLVRTEKFDIIHPDFEADVFLCGLAVRPTPCKMVWHVRLTTKYAKDIIHERLADGFIGISEGVKQRFSQKTTSSPRFEVIYNGVDCNVFRPVENRDSHRLSLGLPADRFILLFTGQIKPGKGIYDLAEALAILRREKKTLPLTLYIGWAPNDAEYQKLKDMVSQNGLDDDVRYIPQQRNIHEWMQAADALILPSHEQVEGMGRVLFEAMACGAAVIGTDTSGVREALTPETGFLVPEKSPAEIAAAVEKLMNDDKLLGSMKTNARTRALEVFDINIHARKVEAFYYKILGLK